MPLKLYRRHSQDCRVHELAIPAAAKREFTDCECVIWISGQTDKQLYPRQSTKLRDWKAAESLLRSLKVENKDTAVHGPTLQNCVERYLDSRKSEWGPGSLKINQVLL